MCNGTNNVLFHYLMWQKCNLTTTAPDRLCFWSVSRQQIEVSNFRVTWAALQQSLAQRLPQQQSSLGVLPGRTRKGQKADKLWELEEAIMQWNPIDHVMTKVSYTGCPRLLAMLRPIQSTAPWHSFKKKNSTFFCKSVRNSFPHNFSHAFISDRESFALTSTLCP